MMLTSAPACFVARRFLKIPDQLENAEKGFTFKFGRSHSIESSVSFFRIKNIKLSNIMEYQYENKNLLENSEF